MNPGYEYIDQSIAARVSDLSDLGKLREYLVSKGLIGDEELLVEQFPGGYSNLTFLLKLGDREFVLRKPPFGANIKSAHDMGREFKVLSVLKPVFPSVPEAVVYCDDDQLIGTPFYIMERVRGVILRNRLPKGLAINTETMRSISEAAIDKLAMLHTIDIQATGLIHLGKPEGYVQRQVEGWVKRYFNAETDQVPAMNETAEWLAGNMPVDNPAAFIHNDYKYDNLVLDPGKLSNIIAVLDWEMATVGDPLMDLGTSLAYWAEAGDSDALKPFNLTWMDGNLSREEVLNRYALLTGKDVSHFLFYYVFGSFKIAVIVQQIYARYKKGFTNDPRFATLGYVVRACAENAYKAIKYKRVSNFY